MNDYLEEIKLILLGESGVGKTAIIKRYLYDKFDLDKTPSTSMNYVEKDIEINNKKFKLNIWDTIGQEKYRSLSKLFLNETQIVILVYSINDLKSFKELDYWRNLYKEQLGEEIILGVAGNKSDLFLSQEVTEEEGREFAKENNGFFSLLSAKENKIGIDEFIFQLVKEYINVKYNKIDLNDFEIIESREKGLILDKKQLEELGYNQEGCCGVKAKSRRKKYEEILKNNKGCIESIFLGDDGVGKTSLIKRIDAKNFDEKEKHTDELNKYETKYTNSTMQVTLNIHDINNANKKNKSTEQIIINCQIYFLVYDLNNANSFDEIDFWIKVIKNCKKEKEKDDSVIVIIGNKKDLNNNENKSSINEDNNFDDLFDKGKKLANEIDAIFYTTTAKNDKEIKDIIGIAVEKYLNS